MALQPSNAVYENLTFEKVWAALMENREQMKETDRRMQETDRQMKETERSIKDTGLQVKETSRIVKELGKRFGDLGNRFGELSEQLVISGVEDRFNELGFKFKGIITGGLRINDENRKIKTEIDILLENGDYIIAVEVKARPGINDIEHHIKRLEILREFRNGSNDEKKKIRGALAGAIFPDEVMDAALDAGFYVLTQSGDTMKIKAPNEDKIREL